MWLELVSMRGGRAEASREKSFAHLAGEEKPLLVGS